ncbi:uncharacterized protein [Procambarus clarkii]|uniref:uncharacterized protein n=1 Tax=Procambarus clarkii TaxID=6728 RepID=UPI003742C7A9
MWGLMLLFLLCAGFPICRAQTPGKTSFTTNRTCSVILSLNVSSGVFEVSTTAAAPDTQHTYHLLTTVKSGSHLYLPQKGFMVPESFFGGFSRPRPTYFTEYSLLSVLVESEDSRQWNTSGAASVGRRYSCSASAPTLTRPTFCPRPTATLPCYRIGRGWTPIMLASVLGVVFLITLCLAALACLQHKEISRLQQRIDIVLLNIARENQKFTRQEEDESCYTDTRTQSHTSGAPGDPSHTSGAPGNVSQTSVNAGDPSPTYTTFATAPLYGNEHINNLLEASDTNAYHIYANINELVPFRYGPLITGRSTNELVYQTTC